jgi:hypothetical protein
MTGVSRSRVRAGTGVSRSRVMAGTGRSRAHGVPGPLHNEKRRVGDRLQRTPDTGLRRLPQGWGEELWLRICRISGRIRSRVARVTAGSDPGRQKTAFPSMIPARARER